MKKTITKVLALVLSMLLVFSLAACSGSNETTDNSTEAPSVDTSKELNIGIIQYVSHPSLDNCYAGIADALKESGLNCKIDRQIGSDTSADSDCATYASTMVAQKYDMIFAIATPAAISAYAATEGTDIPVIFCAVSDPVEAKLVADMKAPGGNCTGTSDVLDLDAQVDLIQAMKPETKSIGVLYTTSEPNSISQLALLKDICDERGLKVESIGIQNDADIPSAAATLCSKVDCVNNFTDNKVVNNLSVLVSAANDKKIPVFGSEVEQVKNGCLASVSIDYVALGKVTGEMGVKVLGGEDIKTMAVETISDATPVINTDVVEALGLSIPESFANAETVSSN